jgi:tyrosyl-tRNA synthetase
VGAIQRGLEEGTLHPAEQKRRLAGEVVASYHGEEAAVAAEQRFDRVHREHEIPQDGDEAEIPPAIIDKNGRVWLPRLLAALGLASSNADGARLVEQRGVRLDGVQVEYPNWDFKAEELSGQVLQVGRRRFVRLR